MASTERVTTPEAQQLGDWTLDEITEQIRQSYRLAITSAQDAIDCAQMCGRALTAAKARVEHGEWLPWLAANCPEVAPRTAQKWMRLAAAEAQEIESADTINHALDLIAAPRQIRPEGVFTGGRLDGPQPAPEIPRRTARSLWESLLKYPLSGGNGRENIPATQLVKVIPRAEIETNLGVLRQHRTGLSRTIAWLEQALDAESA